VKLHLPAMHGWEPTVGVNGMYQANNAGKGTEFVIPTYHALDIGPFVHAKRSFGSLDVSAGVRYDVRLFENDALYARRDPESGFDMATVINPNDSLVLKRFDAYSHTFSGVSASAGIAYKVSERVALKANIAQGYRAPNAAEISAKGVHPGTGFEQLGNADFQPESNLQEDVGVFFNSTHVSGSVELFNNNISNYIYNEKLASAHGGDSLFTPDYATAVV
jgi:iron complex outermembrane receptor protein